MQGSNLLVMNSMTSFLTSQINNISTDTIEVDIIRINNNMPVNWYSGLCADVCYPAIIDSIRVKIFPFDTLNFKMYFTHIGSQSSDTAHTHMMFRNVSNSNIFFLQDYYATCNSSLSGINNAIVPTIKIFPNPANENIFIKGVELGSVIQIFDATGRLILETKSITNSLINISELNAEIYFVLVKTNEGNVMHSKFVKE